MGLENVHTEAQTPGKEKKEPAYDGMNGESARSLVTIFGMCSMT